MNQIPKVPFWIFIVLAALYFSAARLDVMDIDASQYAEMSREMTQQSNWLFLFDRTQDYLDKPPFLFWASALSMKIFGVNNFSYRLPSILFALLGLFSTYRLSRLLYGERTGRIAALILGACQGIFLWTNDVRTDTILMGTTITAIWLIQEWVSGRKLSYLVAGCAAIAVGMMTKGPIALLVPCFAFGTHWILRREWKNFLQPAYLLGLLVIAVLLIPMSIGLYQQFDLHPEKVMAGKTGISGLRFFYWSQSFGRITGESPWNNNAPFSFLFENMLWGFLPWILLFVAALLINVYIIFRQKFRLKPHQEWISTGGFLLTYCALGSSKYQLPHYLFIAFPFAAMMVASLLKNFWEGKFPALFKIAKPTQWVISILLLIAAGLTFMFVFKGGFFWYLLWMAGVGCWFFVAFHKKITLKFFWLSVASIIIANVFMTHHFYWQLMKFQAGGQIGRYLHSNKIPNSKTRIYHVEDPLNSVHFYAQNVLFETSFEDTANVKSGHYVITGTEGLNDFARAGIETEILKTGSFFKVSELTPIFINPATRSEALKNYYILKIK